MAQDKDNLTSLKNNSPEQRWYWVRELAQNRAPDAVSCLTGLSRHDDDALIREEAVRALASFNEPSVPLLLLEVLRNESVARVRSAAAAGLRHYNNSKVVDGLIAALHDDDCLVQCAAARSLGTIGDPRAIPALVSCLLTESDYVREELINSLCQFGSATLSYFLAGTFDEISDRGIVVDLLQAVGSTHTEQLTAALQSQSASVRECVALALGRIADNRWLPQLLAATEDQDLEVAIAAITSLRSFFNETTLNVLVTGAKTSDVRVRTACAHALGGMKHSRAVAALVNLLEDEAETVYQSAGNSLAEIGSQAIDPLILKLKDDREWIRQRLVATLTAIGDTGLTPLMNALQHEDWRVREGAARALGNLPDH